MIRSYKVYTDGGARGNPGPAGTGVVIEKCQDGKCEQVKTISKYIGKATNNQAEYSALILALEALVKLEKVDEVNFHLDSQLVVEQLNGNYKVKNENIKPLFEKAKKMIENFSAKTMFIYIPRERNKLADKLVNQAIDEGTGASL